MISPRRSPALSAGPLGGTRSVMRGPLCLFACGAAAEERADADELALAADQCRSAPGPVRRRGEDRLVQQIFPGAGEFAAREDESGRCILPAAEARDHDAVALL